jgi:hypothetical protein
MHNNCTVEINDTQSFLNKEIYAYRSIWRAVITQALMDASSNSKKIFAKKQKVVALKWLLDEKNNDEFKEVCHLADLDYEKILKQVKMALNRGCRWRNNKSA